MTITVQAGITARPAAGDCCAAENQRLPIDVPRPDQATLGGALAVNVSGPRRYGFGTLRDYVIGISVVNDEGQEVKAGGRVVKNVAGYDLCKLHIGALGTLGIITQVTLKLRPLPEAQALVELAAFRRATGRRLTAIDCTERGPGRVCLELNGRAAPGSAATGRLATRGAMVAVVGFEDNRRSRRAGRCSRLHAGTAQSRGCVGRIAPGRSGSAEALATAAAPAAAAAAASRPTCCPTAAFAASAGGYQFGSDIDCCRPTPAAASCAAIVRRATDGNAPAMLTARSAIQATQCG